MEVRVDWSRPDHSRMLFDGKDDQAVARVAFVFPQARLGALADIAPVVAALPAQSGRLD